MREEDRRDLDVIMNQVALGKAVLRIQDFVQIRDRQSAAFDYELRFLTHLFLTYRAGSELCLP
jgi:hypothetical protein